MPPFVNGWTEQLDAYPPADVGKAKAMMSDAGYADGFTVALNCPNDRYINDEAQHFPLIKKKETDFYMLGWGVPTYDSEYIFNFLAHTTTDKLGSWNGTRYSNADLDAKIEMLASETNLDKRNATIGEIWNTVQAETIYLPIHHQILNWGMKNKVDFPVSPSDQPHFKYMKLN